ncbi:UDP-N-acetylglucosamine--dolichyl-phosphate N-acetylglucosaminephosphotransferase [Sporobolomyces salmoneus]|uniref:UDP-N-acetylglucosamine--dolichyl-phosphate N-acetylglucosaminephosphotransferase n=1 Tax=Sporobolomyces salmoneus TaxID=183962 RepID=UPI00317B01F8
MTLAVIPPPPNPTQSNSPSNEPTLTLLLSLFLSSLAYFLTSQLVPFLSNDLIEKGLRGRDMLKPGFTRQPDSEPQEGEVREGEEEEELPGRKWIPEATGVIGASVYILLLSLFAPLPYLSSLLPSSSSSSDFSTTTSGGGGGGGGGGGYSTTTTTTLEGSLNFPHHSFSSYLASLLSLLIAIFLGFCDDVFDIRWRFKLPIPLIASVPLLVTYAAGHGVTDVVIPNLFGLRILLNVVSTNGVLHLGWMYYLYMSLLSTFCTNSINILAGINGVEVSQALIISLSLILNDLLYLPFSPSLLLSLLPSSLLSNLPEAFVKQVESMGPWSFGFSNGSSELEDRHLFSLYFMLPLVGVCFGLLKHNWYPSRAFIGDTFCYFSGMSFAVTSILSHYSKTLLLFFLPQIFNFLYSCPQLFGFVPCPRHRLPRFDEKSGLLEPSWAVVRPRNLRTTREKIGVGILLAAEKVGLVGLRRSKEGGGEVEGCTNLTILNLILLWRGKTREDKLCWCLIGIQCIGSAVGFGVRYGLGGWVYGGDRR